MILLITGAWQYSYEHIQIIKNMRHYVILMQDEHDEIPIPYESIEGVICNGLFLWHPIEKFLNLRYIQLTSSGYDRVPIKYINDHDIIINNARGVYSIPIAESVLCNVLMLYRESLFFIKNQKNHIWMKKRNLLELCETLVCIVGCGSVGMECAKRFKAFGCKVIGIDISPFASNYFDKMLSLDKLNSILSEVDVVVLTLPLTEITCNMFNEERLKIMKNSAILVNVSRGGIVDIACLTQALCNHLIGGAILDVFPTEPLTSDSELWDMSNVIITPHNSFVGEGNKKRLSELIINNLQKHTLHKKEVKNNYEKGYFDK